MAEVKKDKKDRICVRFFQDVGSIATDFNWHLYVQWKAVMSMDTKIQILTNLCFDLLKFDLVTGLTVVLRMKCQDSILPYSQANVKGMIVEGSNLLFDALYYLFFCGNNF